MLITVCADLYVFCNVQLREWYKYKHKVSCKQLEQKKSIHALTNDAKNSNV